MICLGAIEKVRQGPNPVLRILGVVITHARQAARLSADIRQQIQKVDAVARSEEAVIEIPNGRLHYGTHR